MIKRTINIIISSGIIILIFPIILISIILILVFDNHFPIYSGFRVGKNGTIFKMYKLKTMRNDKFSKVVSTSSDDPRITVTGNILRKFKIDELSQFYNVLIGDMNIVGPRPNVIDEVKLYNEEENFLLSVKPGITDFSSIIFSDLNSILKGSKNPNLDYNQLIRPWKSRMGIFYIKNKSFALDLSLIFLTFISIFSRDLALKEINKILVRLNADKNLINIAKRKNKLIPTPPPGSSVIVKCR